LDRSQKINERLDTQHPHVSNPALACGAGLLRSRSQ
jgi:hypothetical protein